MSSGFWNFFTTFFVFYIYIIGELVYNLLERGDFMPTDKPRFTVTIPDDMMKEIDDYRFKNRCRSQSQAINELLKKGFDVLFSKGQNAERPAEAGGPSDESRFMELYSRLDAEGRDLFDYYLDLPRERRHLLVLVAQAFQADSTPPPFPSDSAP